MCPRLLDAPHWPRPLGHLAVEIHQLLEQRRDLLHVVPSKLDDVVAAAHRVEAAA
jgi:hypothetical protein